MSPTARSQRPRLGAVLREGERVTPLELFFDLVFVIALTQCTTLMYRTPSWEGLAKGLLVLGILWWSWVGYAWLTSVVDPEEGAVRLVIFAAVGALLLAAMCVPHSFGDEAVVFACAYAVVRAAHIALFLLASRGDRDLRRSVLALAGSTALGVGLLLGGALGSRGLQLGLWCVALALDMIGPYLFGAEGWRLVPGHFAERHGLVIIIALGESIAAIAAGAAGRLSAGVVLAAMLGVAVAAALWWLYFDVVAIVAERRLAKAHGRERNELARDSYSYLHFPMVAAVALIALGLKRTIAHVSQPLPAVAAAALLGGAAVYLAAHVAFRLRNLSTLNRQRLVCALALAGLFAADRAVAPAALVTLAVLAALLAGLIAYEATRFAATRDRVRHRLAREAVPE